MGKDDIKLIKEKERKEQELREIANSLGFSREFKIYFLLSIIKLFECCFANEI